MPREKRSTEYEQFSTVKRFDSVFSERLSELVKRKKKVVGKEKLCTDLSVSKRVVELWEARQSRPDIDRLSSLADYFGVTVDYLVGRDISPDAPTLEAAYIQKHFGLTPKAQKALEDALELRAISKRHEAELESDLQKKEWFIRESTVLFQPWDIVLVINFLLEDGVPADIEHQVDTRTYHQAVLDLLVAYLNCNPCSHLQIDMKGRIEEYKPTTINGEGRHNPNIIRLSRSTIRNIILDELLLSIKEREQRLEEWGVVQNVKK